jgi:hypothetical protein
VHAVKCDIIKPDIFNKTVTFMYFVGNGDRASDVVFAHQTQSIKAAQSIVDNGFDLTRIDETALRYGAPESMYQHDPIGMYSFAKDTPRDPDTPLLTFTLNKTAKVLWHDLEGAEIKALLFKELQASSRQDMTEKLKAFGVDAIASVTNDSELIVLNFSMVQWEGVGIDRDVKPVKSQTPSHSTIPTPVNVDENVHLASTRPRR